MSNAHLRAISINRLIDSIVLLLIGGLSLFYSLYRSRFAQLHISPPFLKFPVFVGEAVLGVCMVLVIVKFILSRSRTAGRNGLRISFQDGLIILFFAFVVIKAFYGYLKWGPLALRNAALFYYSSYALIAYACFDIDFFRNRLVRYGLLTAFLSITIIMLPRASVFYYFNYCMFIMLLLPEIRYKPFLYVCAGIIAAVCYAYVILLTKGRDIWVSNIFSYAFVSAILFFYFLRLKVSYRLTFFTSIILLMGLFAWSEGDRSSFRSLFDFKNYISEYIEYSKQAGYRKDFNFAEAPVTVYENKHTNNAVSSTSRGPTPQSDSILRYIPAYGYLRTRLPDRLLPEARINVIWRVLMWQDMFDEFVNGNKLVGVDFGRPFRSKRAEAKAWSAGEEVGWLEPHNSYIHILYRTGVVGFLFIFLIVELFIKLLISFVRIRNIKGILLCSALLYWLVIANFSVILELPYFAIPFWSLLGTTYGYYKQIAC